MAEQDFSEIARLSERFNKDPKSRIFVQLADAYRKNNMVDEAIEVLKQGLQFHPQYPLAYLIMSKCLFDKRMFVQAKDALEKTLKFDPQNIVALRTLAQICESMKDEAGQLAAYKGILTIDPFDAMAKEKLTALEAKQRKEPLYTITMAQEYERQNNLVEALKVYEHLSFTDPSDLGIQEKIGELRQKLAPKEEKREEEEISVGPVIKEEPIKEKPIPEAPELISVADFLYEKPKKEEKPVKTVEKKPEEKGAVEPPGEKAVPEHEILSLEDFLLEKPKEEKMLKETIEAKPEQPSIVESTTKEEPEIKPSAPEPEVLSLEDFLIETPKVTEEQPKEVLEVKPKVVPTIEPMMKEEPTLERLIPETLESQPSEDILLKIPPAEEQHKETVKITPEIPKVEEVEKEKPREVIEVKPEEEEKPEAIRPEEQKEEKKEEPKKPKEEDFKSFQDWLSGLLK